MLTNPDGGKIRLGDIATIRDGFAEQDIITKFNGKLAAIILVKEVGSENPLEISKLVYDYVENASETWMPDGVELEAWSDSSFYLQGRIDMLLENGFIGFLLVLVTLAIFLRPSLALFVAIGIPVSFLATIAIAPALGITINLLSLFAFILVLGIVVDDAIVVGESVFTEFQNNGHGVESAIEGASAGFHACDVRYHHYCRGLHTGVLSTGYDWQVHVRDPRCSDPTLLFSLVQSKLILPYHLTLCHVGDREGRERLNPISKLQRRFSDGMERFIQNVYMPTLDKALSFRWLTLSLFLFALAASIALVAFGVIRFVFFPNVPSDYIFLELKMAEGTPLPETQKAIERVDRAIDEISAEQIDQGFIDPVRNKSAFIGYSVVSGGPGPASMSSAPMWARSSSSFRKRSSGIPMPTRSLEFGVKRSGKFLAPEN